MADACLEAARRVVVAIDESESKADHRSLPGECRELSDVTLY